MLLLKSMKLHIFMAALLALALGCGGTDTTYSSSGEGGAGGAGGSNTNDPVQLGFGAYAAPCGSDGTFIEKADDDDELGSLASLPIRLPFSGTVVRATVVHAIQSANGFCNTTERKVLVSNPTNYAVPESPGLHEQMLWTEAEIAEAPIYEMPGVTSGMAVELGRDLAVPMHGDKGDYVHLGSLFESTSVCAIECGSLLNGSPPPKGHAKCVLGESWGGCAGMPSPTPDSPYYAFVGWADVIPD